MNSIIYPGKKMIYKDQGHNAIVKVDSKTMTKEGMLVYKVIFPQVIRRKYLENICHALTILT